MTRSRQTSRILLWPALAAAVFAFAMPVQAQSSSATSGTGTSTPSGEMQRGVPGVDVDTRAGGQPTTGGTPGVDVDVRNRDTTRPERGVQEDTRTSGAGAAMTEDERRARADRN